MEYPSFVCSAAHHDVDGQDDGEKPENARDDDQRTKKPPAPAPTPAEAKQQAAASDPKKSKKPNCDSNGFTTVTDKKTKRKQRSAWKNFNL